MHNKRTNNSVMWFDLWILVLSTHLNDQPTNDGEICNTCIVLFVIHLYKKITHIQSYTITHVCRLCAYTEQHSHLHTHHSHKRTSIQTKIMLCARAQHEQRINENGSINGIRNNSLSMCLCVCALNGTQFWHTNSRHRIDQLISIMSK